MLTITKAIQNARWPFDYSSFFLHIVSIFTCLNMLAVWLYRVICSHVIWTPTVVYPHAKCTYLGFPAMTRNKPGLRKLLENHWLVLHPWHKDRAPCTFLPLNYHPLLARYPKTKDHKTTAENWMMLSRLKTASCERENVTSQSCLLLLSCF